MSMSWETKKISDQFDPDFDVDQQANWANTNEPYRRDYPHREGDVIVGIVNGMILSAIVWIPVLIYFWRTR